MSGCGIDFLENWIQQNVTEADKKGSRRRAKELAKICIMEAAANGITIDDMEPEWGSVETIIFEAMQDILGDELEFWKAVAAMRAREMNLFIDSLLARPPGMGLRMTQRGAEFLDVWIDASITGELGEQANAGNLAAKLLADAAVAGFTLADMGLEDATVEDYIREVISHLLELGSSGD